jgi:hypothetical protein
LTSPEPFVFVVGCGRSGTTLVRAMLDAHPVMAVPPESYFVARMIRRPRDYEAAGGFDVDRFVADLESNPWYRKWGLEARMLRAALEPSPLDLADAVRRVFHAYASAYDKPRYGDKTPSYVRHIGLLARTFPEARFLHVVRDGRDVALSFLRVPFGPRTLEEAALVWRSRVLAGRRAGAALGPERYQEIRYETLVREPEEQLRDVARFCDLLYDSAMLRFNEHADRLMATGVPGAHKRLASPPAPSTRTWRDQLGKAEVRRFELLAGDALTCFGYDVTTDLPNPLHRSAAQAIGRVRVYRAAGGRRLRRIRQASRTPLEDR